MKILITGGAGFIGSNLVRFILKNTEHTVINVDKLTYAGNLISLEDVKGNSKYTFEKADICDFDRIKNIFEEYNPDSIMHLAAESHVDRSIDGPSDFINTNIVGTYNILQVSYNYYRKLDGEKKKKFRFLHISTDEVFGSLGKEGFFTEETPYSPRSPYSASKASSDHLVRAWYHTFGLPTLITNCSNNYGPYQFPEKLIPVVILNAINGKQIPVYGKGDNVRDWLYVEDHVRAMLKVLESGKIGETYNIGGKCEKTNLEIINTICNILDKIGPMEKTNKYSDLIEFVQDRPGHDKRYAIDPGKIERDLGFSPEYSFNKGIELTVKWYLTNQNWCNIVIKNKYNLERLGTL